MGHLPRPVALPLANASCVALLALLVSAPPILAAAPPRPLLVTVDDLPVAAGSLHADPDDRQRVTGGLLAALARHRVPAVGFVIWGQVRDSGDRALLERWLTAGHELGNHSDRHLNLTTTDAATWIADGERARAGLDGFLHDHGRSLRFFRFPFLHEGDTDAKVAAGRAWLARTGQRNLTVTIDDQDWSFEEAWVKAKGAAARDRVAADYLTALQLSVRHCEEVGDHELGRRAPQVLLLHANAVGAANWDRLFGWLEKTGHRFATADEVLADPAFAELPALAATHGFSLWDRLGAQRRDTAARAEVEKLLAVQSEAWSRGDLEAFCSAYAEDATFLSPAGLVHGRKEVLERYRRRYPGREAMGALTLDVVEMRTAWGTEISMLGDAVPSRVHSVTVVARWTLKRAGQAAATGFTMIVLRPHGDGWEIVEDASM
jgi:peptidoglycan/xylan/chitin deacetylase (PgdA/CDA1 family)/ketosteroid isomerase-like protein